MSSIRKDHYIIQRMIVLNYYKYQLLLLNMKRQYVNLSKVINLFRKFLNNLQVRHHLQNHQIYHPIEILEILGVKISDFSILIYYYY